MLALSNKGKTIEISFGNKIVTSVNESRKTSYTIIPTEITCSSYADAEIIQKKLNNFLYTISKEVIK